MVVDPITGTAVADRVLSQTKVSIFPETKENRITSIPKFAGKDYEDSQDPDTRVSNKRRTKRGKQTTEQAGVIPAGVGQILDSSDFKNFVSRENRPGPRSHLDGTVLSHCR